MPGPPAAEQPAAEPEPGPGLPAAAAVDKRPACCWAWPACRCGWASPEARKRENHKLAHIWVIIKCIGQPMPTYLNDCYDPHTRLTASMARRISWWKRCRRQNPNPKQHIKQKLILSKSKVKSKSKSNQPQNQIKIKSTSKSKVKFPNKSTWLDRGSGRHGLRLRGL